MKPSSLEEHQRMLALLRQLAHKEGYNPTALPDVRILRSDRPLVRTPVLYEPGLVIVCQGRKRGYFGDDIYVYDEQHYLAVSVPVPFTMETDASATKPLLAIYMQLNLSTAAEVALLIDRHAPSAPSLSPRGMFSSPMDAPFRELVSRFLQVLNHPLEAEVLGPGVVRELYFCVLTGEQGSSMRAALAMQGQFGKISKALRHIHATFDGPLDVKQLAYEANMSVPTFHSHFKAITHTSPMQYVKSVRLHQARLLIFRHDMTAAAASVSVGYESVSQFSREFKRLFGRSPKEEVRRMKGSFALPPAQANAPYISSH